MWYNFQRERQCVRRLNAVCVWKRSRKLQNIFDQIQSMFSLNETILTDDTILFIEEWHVFNEFISSTCLAPIGKRCRITDLKDFRVCIKILRFFEIYRIFYCVLERCMLSKHNFLQDFKAKLNSFVLMFFFNCRI